MTATECGRPVCDFPPAPLYYGILGKPAFLHVPIPSDTQRFSLEKEKKVILEDEAEAGSVRDLHTHDVQVFLGGVLKISRCVRNHSGEYRWRTFGSDGEPQCDLHAPDSQ
ncbi:hypothetical protein KOW79_015105 [Hemibagrus wyckioides]|uniref:Uncharacterized protein n=1 Tax=Hemibagrus wyckioides TaxID=337641 RepID=A0A9D3SEE5_9TELE|nr:hypothetical protein KOW79_015105 [Hemibagrus wyckioides]